MRRALDTLYRAALWASALCLVAIALGFIGALLGTYLAHAAGLPELFAIQIGGKPFPIIWSIIGSALFVAILSLITRRRVY